MKYKLKSFIVAVLMIMLGSENVWAETMTDAGYVITASETAYLGGDSKTNITSFSPSTCLWTGSSGGYWQNLSGYYLGLGNNTLSISKNAKYISTLDGTPTTENGAKIYYDGILGDYYLRYNNGWGSENKKNNGTSCVFKVEKTVYDEVSTLPAISGPEEIRGVGSKGKFTRTDAKYTKSYINYYFRSQNHYFESDNSTSLSEQPQAESFTYTWSLSDNANGYATIDEDGLLTYNRSVDSELVVDVTLTAVSTSKTYTETQKITLVPSLLPPSITILPVETSVSAGTMKTQAPTAVATISATDAGTLYYRKGTSGNWTQTADGTTVTIAKGDIIQAYTASNNTVTYSDSKVSSGGYVVLQDLEDHNWTYYKGLDVNVGDVAYKTKYASDNVKARLYSPDPRNVEIIYDGCGYLDSNGNGLFDDTTQGYGVQVSVDGEYENTFIYYETLDKNSDGTYSYSVIPNPFSVRPSKGNQYYGCRKWIVKSLDGGTITDANGNNIGVNGLIDGDTDIKFTPTSTYTENCISMKVVLCAFWEKAIVNILTGSQASSEGYAGMKSTEEGGHRELQFIVLNKTEGSRAGGGSQPVTFTMVAPDGSVDYRGNSENNRLSELWQSAEPYKIEFCRVAAPENGYNAGHFSEVFDIHFGRGMFNERGYTHNYCRQMENKSTVSKKEYRLRVESGVFNFVSLTAGFYGVVNKANYAYECGVTISESLKVNTIWGCDYDRAKSDNTKLSVNYSFTLANGMVISKSQEGNNYVNILFKSGNFFDELPEGTVDGVTGSKTNNGRGHFSVYLADASKINGWNGHRYVEVQGGSFLNFAGGWSSTPNGNPAISYRIKNGIWGGCIYGSGSESPTTGDNYFVFTGGTIKGWIAGGCNGLVDGKDYGSTDGTAYLYVGGNTNISGESDEINYAPSGNIYASSNGLTSSEAVGKMTNGTNVIIADNAKVAQGVYGGGHSGYSLSTANVIVAGGTVGGGVYGGSKRNQTQGENANVMIVGGNISGGVFGACNVSGSLKGTVNVTMLGGTVSGNLYGGGYNAAASISPVVKVFGGTVDQVFGGGKGNGATLTGSPSVTVKQTAESMAVTDVYGGGDAASVTGNTTVSIEKGTISHNVFGGGNQAAVNGSTSVKVIGATTIEGNVYGGGNAGEVTGKTYVQIGEEETTK